MNVSLVKSFIDIIFQTEILTFLSLTNSECQSKCTDHAAAMLDLSHGYDLFVDAGKNPTLYTKTDTDL